MNEVNNNNELIENHKKCIKEVEEFLHNRGDTQISYTTDHIKMLIDMGRLPKELGEFELKRIKEIENRCIKVNELKKNYPNITMDELIKYFHEGKLSSNDTLKFYKDMVQESQVYMMLLQNSELLKDDPVISEKINKTLFSNINTKEDMGIVRAITDSLYHLEKILHEMRVNYLHGTTYEAKGSVKNSKGEEISLEYIFRACSDEDAQNALEEYKTIMLKKGLRAWMAYWCSANERGRVEYKCDLTDVMKWTADEEREAYFQAKEKEEFWCLTKMLGMTKLSRSKIVKKRGGKGKEYIQWIEQPLVEIYGGERLSENEDKFPKAIAVRVLMPKMGKNSFVPALYKISTMKLNPSDIFLAFIVQTRASQMERGERQLFFDWDYLFEISNLQQTAISNSRVARAKMRSKMDKLKEGQIIEECEEHLIGMSVQPRKNRKLKK